MSGTSSAKETGVTVPTGEPMYFFYHSILTFGRLYTVDPRLGALILLDQLQRVGLVRLGAKEADPPPMLFVVNPALLAYKAW